MSIYKDGSYIENNPSWHEEHSAWKASHIVKLLEANSVKANSIAEVGCGAGQILVEIEEKMPDVDAFYGFEISPQAYKICKQKEAQKISFDNFDILSNPPQKKYDIAMAIDVFEHVEDYLDFIRKMKVISNYQVFHIPLELSVSSMLRPKTLANARAEVGHIQFFTKQTALASLEHAGLKIIDVANTSVALEVATNNGAKLMRYPRKFLNMISPDLTGRILGGTHALVLCE